MNQVNLENKKQFEEVTVYAVMCRFYQEPSIEKMFFSEQEAAKYAKKYNDEYETDSWYIQEFEILK